MDMIRETFTSNSGFWIHLKTDEEPGQEAGDASFRGTCILVVLHGGLAGAVSLPLPGLSTLWGGQAEGPYRGPGEGDSQILPHPPLCALHSQIGPSDWSIFQ